MFDIPETLIIFLAVVLLVLGTRHWISTIAPDRSRQNNNTKG
jgi:hypothetical protein